MYEIKATLTTNEANIIDEQTRDLPCQFFNIKSTVDISYWNLTLQLENKQLMPFLVILDNLGLTKCPSYSLKSL